MKVVDTFRVFVKFLTDSIKSITTSGQYELMYCKSEKPSLYVF